jgi:hypothetical protein
MQLLTPIRFQIVCPNAACKKELITGEHYPFMQKEKQAFKTKIFSHLSLSYIMGDWNAFLNGKEDVLVKCPYCEMMGFLGVKELLPRR